jgi:hypothetical protein
MKIIAIIVMETNFCYNSPSSDADFKLLLCNTGDVSSILYNAYDIDQYFRYVENKILASIICKIPTQQYFQDNTN